MGEERDTLMVGNLGRGSRVKEPKNIMAFPVPNCRGFRLIPGECRVVGKLGSGSYGTVYLTEFRRVDGKSEGMAVKRGVEDLEISCLLKEYRVYQALRQCPEITRCHGVKANDKQQWNLYLEYASGGTLKGLIGKGLAEKEVRAYTRMILRGLEYMHERGFVHCDLKPENILAFPSEEEGCFDLKLADFGVAKEPGEKVERKAWRGRFRGTPLYMSPESVKVGVILPELDIWSLGCIVVVMVTGRWPWLNQVANPRELTATLSRFGAAPKVPENLSDQGKDFLNKCFDRCYRTRWSATMLLHHPFLSS